MAALATTSMELIDLAQTKADQIQHMRGAWSVSRIAAAPFQWLLNMLHGGLVRVMERNIRATVEQAVWFKGAWAEVNEMERLRELDPDDELRGRLEKLEVHLVEIRKLTMAGLDEIKADESVKADELAALHKRMLVAEAELFEAVRGFKGALQAHDADFWTISQHSVVHYDQSSLDSALDRMLGAET